MSVRPSLLAASGASVALLAAATLGVAAPVGATALLPLAQGHVDVVDVAYEDGQLEIGVHDESVTPDVERDPADVVFVVKREARITVPADPAYRFLGTPGVSKVWVLPEIQDEALLWPGLSAEEIEPGTFVGDSVRLTATAFSGPDGLSVFTSGPNGEPVLIGDSEDRRPDVVDLPAGDHQHANWAFEKAGTYRVTVVASATRLDGVRVKSTPAVLTFKVQS